MNEILSANHLDRNSLCQLSADAPRPVQGTGGELRLRLLGNQADP
jgi:hypothetical protein